MLIQCGHMWDGQVERVCTEAWNAENEILSVDSNICVCKNSSTELSQAFSSATP